MNQTQEKLTCRGASKWCFLLTILGGVLCIEMLTGCLGHADAVLEWPDIDVESIPPRGDGPDQIVDAPTSPGGAEEEIMMGGALPTMARTEPLENDADGTSKCHCGEDLVCVAECRFQQARQEQITAERRARWIGMTGRMQHKRIWMASDWKSR